MSLPYSTRHVLIGPVAGGVTTLDFPFPAASASHLQVRRLRSGVWSTLTVASQWTVVFTPSPGAGGVVTLLSPAVAGDSYVVKGVMEPARSADLTSTTKFQTASLNSEYDRLWMIAQELRYATDGLEPRVATLEDALPDVDEDHALLIATQEEAETGANVNRAMTPLRTKQSIAVELPESTADLPDSLDRRYITDAQLTALASGSYNGGFTYQSKALMDADTAPVINAVGYVVADATAALNGYYQKTAATGLAGWTRRGDLPWGVSGLSFTDPLIFDPEALLDPTPAVYIPRQRYQWQGGSGSLSTNGTASAILANHVAVPIDAATLTVIYFDTEDATTPYKTAVYPAVMPNSAFGRYRFIASSWGRHIHCPFDYQATDEWGDGRLLFRAPMIVEGTTLLIPPFYRWFPNASTSLVFMQPADGSGYWALDISTSTTEERRHYFDLPAALAGSTPVKTAIGTATPRFPSGQFHILARSMNGRVISPTGYRIVGGGNAGVAANEFAYSLGTDPDRAPYLFTGTTLTDITEPLLTAKGFSRGFVSTGSNRPYAGAALINARPGYYFAARAWYLSTVDDTFATARVYLRKGTNVVSGGTFNGAVETQLSARVRSYTVFGRLPETGDMPDNFIIGMENAAGSQTKVCGIQFATSADPASWIARGDYIGATSPAGIAGATVPAVLAEVTPAALVMGSDIWLTSGRPADLFLSNLFPERTNGLAVTGTLSSVNASGLPLAPTFTDHLPLDPAKLGGTARLDVRHRAGLIDRRYGRTINVHVAPASFTGSPKVLIVGTSLSNRGAAAWLKARMVAMGLTPTFIGTIPGKGTDDGDLTGELGECREGARISEHIYETTGRAPFALGTEATYLGKSKADKMLDMPFVRPATGGDDPAKVYNGHIYDLAFFLSRFSFATPDIIIIELFRNDFAQASSVAQALAWVQNGLAVMIPQSRAAAPAAHIGILLHGLPRATTGDAEWLKAMAAFGEANRFVTAAADPNLHVIPLWEHMNPTIGWGDTLVSTDAITGTETRDWSDQVHFGEFQRRVVAEHSASWAVARLAGV